MTPRICSRCHALLHREDEGSLVFCWNCGAPQVQLSEELREQIEQQISNQISAQHDAANPAVQAAAQTVAPSSAVVWRGAIQCAALAGGIAAVLALLAFVLAPVALLSFFWLISAPIVILGVYSSRFRITRVTASFGARLGLLTGLAILLATMTLDAIGLVLKRFVFHSAADIDTQLATLFTQMHTSIVATSGPAAKTALDMLAIPEFRAGILLASIGLCIVFYLAFSTIAGAFAGYLRARSPR